MATWRVLTWNILGAHGPNLDVIGQVIAGYTPDVVALQEIQLRQARGLARRLGWRVLWTRKHYPYSPLLWWRAEGLAMLSPHPLTETVAASVSPGVSTWIYRHRVTIVATVDRGDGALRVADVHLASHDADERIAQARRVVDVVGGRRPVVVAGDMNAADEPEILREFNSLELVDPGGEMSSPSIAPRQRIDYVLVPAGATVTNRITPGGGEQWNELSDHLPVVVEFTL